MNKPINIKRISTIIDKYEIIILDQWGVMHDGSYGFPDAIDCIKQLINKKKTLIIISNSSRRKLSTLNNLKNLGFNKDHFQEVMTSGEIIWKNLLLKSHKYFKSLGNKCYHLCEDKKEDGLSYTKGLEYEFVNRIEEADFILGTTVSPNKKTIEYLPILKKGIEKKIPFICANPDFETLEYNTKKLNICMGTVSEFYKDLGGLSYYLGKPHTEIYQTSIKSFKKIKKNNILAIGDSMYHDIKGAINFGIDSLLITSGIHTFIFDKFNHSWNNELDNYFKSKFQPTYLSNKLQF